MKVYISADLEGATGINSVQFALESRPEYPRGRNLMMGDLNAAIEGAVLAGATEVLVNDGHGSMRNLMIEDLHEAADLISGFPKSLSMMAGLDESFHAAIFVGYHAKNGSLGILNHTINGMVFDDIEINGVSYGETGINAAICGHYKVPVVLVTGDDQLQKEVEEILPHTEFVRTKKRLSAFAGQMIHPKKTEKSIREAAKRSLINRRAIAPFELAEPLHLAVTVKSVVQADVVEIIPGLKRTAPRILTYEADDIAQAFNMIRTIANACSILNTGMY